MPDMYTRQKIVKFLVIIVAILFGGIFPIAYSNKMTNTGDREDPIQLRAPDNLRRGLPGQRDILDKLAKEKQVDYRKVQGYLDQAHALDKIQRELEGHGYVLEKSSELKLLKKDILTNYEGFRITFMIQEESALYFEKKIEKELEKVFLKNFRRIYRGKMSEPRDGVYVVDFIPQEKMNNYKKYELNFGVTLKPGQYDILIEREGSVPVMKRQVTITEADIMIDVTPEPKKYALMVNPTPKDSTIKIMNIIPKYRPGIALAQGQYDVKVEREGYKTVRQWVALTDADVTLDIPLEPTSQRARPQTLRNTIGMEFVLIPGGKFMMGSNNGDKDEKPIYKVHISQPFYLGKYEVTQAQWAAVMGNNPSHFKGDPHRPVGNISWNMVQDFIGKLNAKEKDQGSQYRLPTEAEWEYAARAGTTTAYSFGDDPTELSEYAWHGDNAGGKTHSVGLRRPNAWGLYDMHGNVWEWVQDRYGTYEPESIIDPLGPPSGTSRVVRGGSFVNSPETLRSARRVDGQPEFWDRNLGFRCVRVSPQP